MTEKVISRELKGKLGKEQMEAKEAVEMVDKTIQALKEGRVYEL